MTPNHTDYQIDYEIREDDRVFNVVQVMFLALTLVAVCAFAARSVGLGWGSTVALAWGCGIFGTLLITVAMFAVQSAVERFQGSTQSYEPEDIDALVGQWDDDLANDPLANGTQLWFGDRAALLATAEDLSDREPEMRAAS
jgi:hypothetical protein